MIQIYTYLCDNIDALDIKLNHISESNDRNLQEFEAKIAEFLKIRVETRSQAEKWGNLREAFTAPVKAVEVNERS